MTQSKKLKNAKQKMVRTHHYFGYGMDVILYVADGLNEAEIENLINFYNTSKALKKAFEKRWKSDYPFVGTKYHIMIAMGMIDNKKEIEKLEDKGLYYDLGHQWGAL